MADLKAKLRNTGTLMAKQTVAGGGKGGATDWAHLKDKPFETLGDDFAVENGELQIAEGSTLEIDNKSIVLDSDGKVSEAVPIYFETVNSGEFWCLDGWEREGDRSNLYRSVLPEEQRLLSNTDITDSKAFYCIVEYEDKTQDALEAGFVKEFDNQYAMRLPREITLYYFPNINNFTLWNGYASNYASVSKIYFTVPLTDGYDVPKEQLNRIVNYHQVGGKYIPIDNWSIVIGSEGRLKTRMNQEDYYTKAEIEALPDNKSIIINDDGKIQEAVPVYTSTEEVITDINRGVALNRGLKYKPEWYYSPIDLPKELDFTNLGLNLYYNDFYSKINNFDITSPQTFTDAEGNTWTTTSNLEYEDEKNANYYLKLKLIDGVEGETGNVRISIDGSETPQYYLYQEYSLLDNWSGYNINLLLQDAETYPIIPRIYFSYYCGGSYNLYLVEASVDNMDVSQPVVITDNNGVNWTLTVTPNADPGKGPYITFVPDNLPSDFQYFNSVWDDEAQESWDLWFNYTGKSTVTKINQLPAEYVPIDNNTITVVDGKLVAQGGGSASGVASVVYNTFVSDNQVGSLDVHYSNGDISSYGVYAPSGGSSGDDWSTIAGKPFETVGEGLEVSGGAIKEKVPIYTETTEEMPAGLKITGWQDLDGIGDDADVNFNIDNNTLTLNTSSDAYTVAAKINGQIYSGSWTAATDQGHSYGGYTWIIPELDANPTCEFYLENIGSGDYNAHIYLNGVNCSNVEWLIITPNNAGDVIENYRDEGIFNLNCSWSYGQQSSTTVHQLPAQYVPIDNDTIINDNGVLKAAGGGSSVDIDNKSIIKNQDDELQEAVPIYNEQVSSIHNSIQNWNVKSGNYHYARQNAYAEYLRGALRNTGDAFYTVIVNFDYNNQTYQLSGICNNIGLGSSNNFISGDILDYFTGFGVTTANSGQGQLYCPDWNKSAGISVNWAVVKEAEYNATYESTDLEIVETVYHQIPYEYIPAEQSILVKNSNGRLSLAKNIIYDMVQVGNGFMRGGYTNNKYPDFTGLNISLSSNSNSIISSNTFGVRTAIGGAFGASNGPGNFSQGIIDFTRRSDKYILESKNNTIFSSIGDNSYAWIGLYYNYVGANNPDYPAGCPFYIVGRMRLGDITNDKADFDIEGCEAILDSAVYDSNISKYVFTFKQDIYPSIRIEYFYQNIAQYKPINDKYQKINSFFLPLDNSTIVRDSDGNITTAIPAPPTTDGNYTLAVTVTNGEPTYSWV